MTNKGKMGVQRLQKILHMNAGDAETSYANNSNLQKTVILKTEPVIEDTLKNLFNDSQAFTECLKIADLGCASGPNTFLVVSKIIDTIHDLSQKANCQTPELEVYLNDQPENDFKSIFKLLPTFYENLKMEKGDEFRGCFISAIPGSFYSRLFPSKSLHFLHSSYSLHWLSQVPRKMKNKGNIYITTTSPPHVFEAYLKQFQKDFSTFLGMRSQEMKSGGRMILTFISRSEANFTTKYCYLHYDLLAKSLLELVSKGIIPEEQVDSFDLPIYTPYKDEVKSIIQIEGSFNLDRLEVFECGFDSYDNIVNAGDVHFEFDKHRIAKNLANCLRAVFEPLFANHFGDFIIDKLFSKYAKLVAEHPCLEDTNMVISLSKQ